MGDFICGVRIFFFDGTHIEEFVHRGEKQHCEVELQHYNSTHEVADLLIRHGRFEDADKLDNMSFLFGELKPDANLSDKEAWAAFLRVRDETVLKEARVDGSD